MSIVNIPKSKQDQHYRYKRQTVELKIEGKGNGIKTVIPNMKEVSDSLNVPMEWPIKYFGLELGALGSTKNDKAVINGKYDFAQVEEVLENFIAKFLLCSKCHLPELDFTIKSNKDAIQTTCRACGNHGQIDSTERLYTTMIKHPPKSKGGFKGEKEAPEATQKPSKSTKSQAGATTEKAAIDDGTWSLDISQEAIKKRREMEGLSERFRELTKGVEDEDEEEEEQEVSPVSILKQFLEVKPNATPVQIYQATRKLKNDYNLTDKDCVCLLYEALFTPENILTDIPKRAPLFKPFISSSGQKLILGYTEELVGVKDINLVTQTSVILLQFYRAELLTKEVLEEWLSKKKSRFIKDSAVVAKIKEAAKPFGEYLMANSQ
ncbi:hypothetical protein FDP41_003093 [Naegleria fowleri]|uniref:W2 domain-containing protein n=1 Tax=Naegleria fowleri TaxID=5763 RepID=A0A6A5BTT9_NAEFO|nr:uncharacterized protein FDP41_003093 [Naegleria fowleri]KAF0977771.1 hypothetical protein FDP41_003093 [Naegleria fowleri]